MPAGEIWKSEVKSLAGETEISSLNHTTNPEQTPSNGTSKKPIRQLKSTSHYAQIVRQAETGFKL